MYIPQGATQAFYLRLYKVHESTDKATYAFLLWSVHARQC